MTVERPRRLPLALAANLLAPPVGHIYAGAPWRGVAATVAWLGLGVLSLLAAVRAASTPAFLFWLSAMVPTPLIPIFDVWIVMRRRKAGYQLRPYNRWFVYAPVALLSILVAGTAKRMLRGAVQAFRLPAGSMLPILQPGDDVLVDRLAYRSAGPERFDIVVYENPEHPEKTYLSRVIGLPGETLELRNRRVWINGAPLEDPFAPEPSAAKSASPSPRDDLAALEIPEDSYFVMGDNRDHSYDSRFFGAIRRGKVWGRVHAIYFSWSDESPHFRWDRIGVLAR